MELIAADIGGTHARFAVATMTPRGIVLGPETVLKTGDFADLAGAWRTLGDMLERPLPRAAAIAIAGPVTGDVVRMTNNGWVLDRDRLSGELGVDRLTLVNDFAAVAYAVPQAELRHLCGPERALPDRGVVTVVGPGTGLGVAVLVRGPEGDRVIATEGGHIEFAPLDPQEQRLRDDLAARFGRVSVERILSGAGLGEIFRATAGREPPQAAELWRLALTGAAPSAVSALAMFCRVLGSVAGDLALAQGGQGVVIAGGLGLRLADYLPQSGFAERFAAKGRFRGLMEQVPVKLIMHPQPGLLGAAAAFAAEHGR
ncbi:glucokinase [Sphingomonas sp. ID1715]|uniref:glucokinase n=1 Tax=Sphingomonas sp. ID1715 TaxID=1656898 RepID=UPI00148A0958|nr:glucokinase [Sphingomonas sp. ID1715]NNM76549.1 glucokinase [Sphingomonas sp. ID1715]